MCYNSIMADNYAYQLGMEESKQQAIEEKYQEISIDDDTLICILTNHFGTSIDCCAVAKAKEDNYDLFMKLSNALNDFVYEVSKNHCHF